MSQNPPVFDVHRRPDFGTFYTPLPGLRRRGHVIRRHVRP
jgi:hypothetical protein